MADEVRGRRLEVRGQRSEVRDVLAIPSHRQVQPLLEAVRWRIAEQPPGFADVRQRMTHVARAKISKADRKSTRLNSSHANISYAVFCFKKKTINNINVNNSMRL